MKIVISSGHGLYVRGASGFVDEVDEARKIVPKVARYLRELGVGVVEYHDNTSKSQKENVNRIVAYHNSQERDLDVSIHLNASKTTDSPMGAEVLYKTASDQAIITVNSMVTASKLKNRGAKYRDNLGFLNNTHKPAILIEICFCDSKADADIYNGKFDDICRAIAESIAGKKLLGSTPSVELGSYVSGRIVPGEAFVVGIRNTVVNGKWELTAVNDWVVAVADTEILGYKPDPSLYHEGKNLYEVKQYEEGVGWFTRGWVHGNFNYLTERPVGYSEMYNEYKYQLRKTAKLYDKNMKYVAELPAGRYFFTKNPKAHPSAPHLMRVDRNETSMGIFSTIYGDYGWIDTNASKGTGKGNFGIRFIED